MKRARFTLVGATVLAGLVMALVAMPATAAEKYAQVNLIWDADSQTCSADPDAITIYWLKNPKKVKWVSDDANLYWDIVWKGGGKDYFRGNFDIKCGKTVKKSTLPSGKDKDNAQWAYSITAYSCQGGQRTGEKLCEVDPVVDWEP